MNLLKSSNLVLNRLGGRPRIEDLLRKILFGQIFRLNSLNKVPIRFIYSKNLIQNGFFSLRFLFLGSLLVLLLLLLTGQAWALSTDREQPINIKADRLDVDDAKGLGIYRGNVVLTQGSARLNADVIRVYSNAQRELNRVEAMGKPAKFRQLMDETREEVTGQALEIIYRVAEEYVVFKGRAYFWKCGDEFSGNQIEYFAPQALVKASQSKQGDERVNVTLSPQSKEGENGSLPCLSRSTSPSAVQDK